MISENTVIDRTKKEEGFRSHLYDDGKGNITIGYGWNIEQIGITEEIAAYVMRKQLESAMSDLYENFKWFEFLPDKIQEALVDMCFNMGIGKLKNFKKMIAAFEVQDYQTAAAEIKNSAYYRDPLTTKRASRNVYIVSNGKLS